MAVYFQPRTDVFVPYQIRPFEGSFIHTKIYPYFFSFFIGQLNEVFIRVTKTALPAAGTVKPDTVFPVDHEGLPGMLLVKLDLFPQLVKFFNRQCVHLLPAC